MPEAFGVEVRECAVLASQGGFDLDRLRSLADAHTRLIIVNSPHNPTGATVSDEIMRELDEFAFSRNIQLVCDEVFHPIYHGPPNHSASSLPHTTVIGDLSKAFALPGLRIGWIREPNAERRAQYVNAREYLSISNTVAGELLAEIAVTNRRTVHDRTQMVTTKNLEVLDVLMRDRSSALQWTRPQGGTTAFIRLSNVGDTRPFCIEAAKQGLLLVPGDCFGFPDHIRLGLGVNPEMFAAAMKRLAAFV